MIGGGVHYVIFVSMALTTGLPSEHQTKESRPQNPKRWSILQKSLHQKLCIANSCWLYVLSATAWETLQCVNSGEGFASLLSSQPKYIASISPHHRFPSKTSKSLESTMRAALTYSTRILKFVLAFIGSISESRQQSMSRNRPRPSSTVAIFPSLES